MTSEDKGAESENVTITAPVFKNGRYDNPPSWGTWNGMPGKQTMAKWIWQRWCGTAEGGGSRVPWYSPQAIDKEIPIKEPEFDKLAPKDSLSITWIGHASVLTQIDGVTVLCDPIWSERCSPFSCLGPKRYRPPPCRIEDLPKIDAAVISHNHYDHLDLNTVRQLELQFGGKGGLEWFVPSGLSDWMRRHGGCANVTELSWGEERTVQSKMTGESARIVCLPAQHWSTRDGVFDRFKTLWAGWAVLGSKHRFFFAGDTGFTPEFGNIGALYGPFDLAAIPIGCYCPREFMRVHHTDPEGSVKIHQLLRSRNSLGIHWGTFDMGSSEHYLEPRAELRRQMEAAALDPQRFRTTAIGETWRIV